LSSICSIASRDTKPNVGALHFDDLHVSLTLSGVGDLKSESLAESLFMNLVDRPALRSPTLQLPIISSPGKVAVCEMGALGAQVNVTLTLSFTEDSNFRHEASPTHVLNFST
jgi:hypothetical protein